MINPRQYGISFSLKQCRNFGLDSDECLQWLLDKGWRRFRLMSYWDEHEKSPGTYDFAALDEQIKRITEKSGIITLCLGVKQPRWPEYHWPSWTKSLSDEKKTEALMRFIETAVARYKNEPAILSYQLENEALLKGFGRDIHIDRGRLRLEYTLVCKLDPSRPVLMSTSNGWGVPLRRPRPWGVGFSLYTIMHAKGAYHRTIQRPWLHQLRAWFIRTALGKPVFIHELQCEPWGPDAIWKMSTKEQDMSMSVQQIAHNIAWAKRVNAQPVDLWGAEWWYWRWQQGDTAIFRAVQKALDT